MLKGSGGVMTAALAAPNANPFGADNMFGYMNGKQMTWLSGLAFLFLYVNLGSVCSHCLYNAATGWSRILGNHMRVMAVILGVIGIVVAAGNVWAFFIQWLSLLGILVPPIGAVIPRGQNAGLFLGLANIGAPDRLNYTAIGDTVNLASRLESLCKEYATFTPSAEDGLLIFSDGVYKRARLKIPCKELGKIRASA